ncbi:unnamed protein product [Clavelina lepadiformis]|uniref:HEAT repeat-containing protein 4 n=1 Tax=Clavelina lepadiformis TaxID=159417 RepID=A0ABP0FXP4_CLALP
MSRNDKKPLEAPVFFPSASRVKIPFVGDDTRHVKVTKPNFNQLSNPLDKHQNNIENSLIKEISKDFEFGKDVIKERCAHTLPYDGSEVLKVYDSSDIVLPSANLLTSGGRFDVRGYLRKLPCNIKKRSFPNAAKMKQKVFTATERHGEVSPCPESTPKSEGIERKNFKQEKDGLPVDTTAPAMEKYRVLPNYVAETSALPEEKHTVSRQWDEHVLNQLSKDTARWIVFDNIDSGSQKDRLDQLIRKKFGGKISNTNLVREDVEDRDLKALERKKLEKKKKLLQEKKLAEKQRHVATIQNDSILQQTFAQYYKLPRFLKQERSKVVTVIDDVNQTAQNLQVKHVELPPPPKMEDFFNPAAGKFINATDNAFEQQLYTNQAKPVFQHNGDKSRIIMDDLSEYQSKLQTMYPPVHKQWSSSGKKKNKPTQIRKGKITRGLQRWKELPNPADFASERGLNPPRSESAKTDYFDMSRSATLLNNAPMIHIIEEWRSKWKLAGRWQEVTLADITIDLENIHDHLRLGAVAACAMAALHKMPVADMAVLAVLPKIDTELCFNNPEVGHLPESLLVKVRACLKDSHPRVCLAAAMCLYALQEITDDVLRILEKNLMQGVPTDKLACAQCLALNGSTDARVLHLLIQMLLESDQQQATALLVHASRHTRLVHSLLAEQLNSSNWKVKVIACNVLSQLSGNINRDLVHKLSNLMWDDWSSEVRKAASRALGQTGHGRDVHFDLREKLVRGNERVCVDVLRKIAHLGIMTATLLPEFVKCFSAEYVSVRLESCRTATCLKIADEKINSELIRLTQYDPAWKIKAHAIKALGEIKVVNEKIQSVLLWALRFEDEPGVRMEACVALRKLKCNASEVILVLQDRVLVEPDQGVKKEVRRTLDAFGMSGPEDNMEMIRQIKSEVKRLCKKSVVAAKVIMYEKELDKFERKAQYIGSILDDMSSEGESNLDDVDPEITNALRQTKSADGPRRDSNRNTPSIAFTLSPERPVTRDTCRERTPSIDNEAHLPPSGTALGFLSPDRGR